MEYFNEGSKIYPISNLKNFENKLKKCTTDIATITNITVNQWINGKKQEEFLITWLQNYSILKDNLSANAKVTGLNNFYGDYATLDIRAKSQIDSRINHYSANMTSLDSIVAIAKDNISPRESINEFNFYTLTKWKVKLYFLPTKEVLGISFLEPEHCEITFETREEFKQLKIYKTSFSQEDNVDFTGKMRSRF